MRVSEAVGLTWNAVDFRRGQIVIDRQLQKRPERDGNFTFVPPKSDKPRAIRPARLVIDMLQSRKQKQVRERFLAGDTWDESNGTSEQDAQLVFINPLDGHLHPHTIHRRVKSMGAAIGVPELYTHGAWMYL